MNAIESHPDYQAVFQNWLAVCKAAGRSKREAEQRAAGHARNVIARRLEREQRFYQGKRHVGPDATQGAKRQTTAIIAPSDATSTTHST